MLKGVKARYSRGAIVPLEPLDIEEGANLFISIQVDTRESHSERERRRQRVESKARQLTAIGRRCARLLKDGPSAVEHGDYLYDENGLPK